MASPVLKDKYSFPDWYTLPGWSAGKELYKKRNRGPGGQNNWIWASNAPLKQGKTAASPGLHWDTPTTLNHSLTHSQSSTQQSWFTGEVPAEWKLAKVMPAYKKGQKDDPGNYSLPVWPQLQGKLGKRSTWVSLHGQLGHQPQVAWIYKSLINLVFFCDKVTWLVDEGKTVDAVSLEFNKVFSTVSHAILLEKLPAYNLNGWTLWWKNLGGWPGPESCGKWS